MTKTIIALPALQPWLDQARVPISLAVKHVSVLYVSGIPPIVPNTTTLCTGGIPEQTAQMLENIKLILEVAATDLSQILRCTLYAVNTGHFPAINEVYKRYFPTNPQPAPSARWGPGPRRSMWSLSASPPAENECALRPAPLQAR